MREQTRSRLAVACAAIVVALAAMLVVRADGGTYSLDHHLAWAGDQVVTSGVAAKTEPDPTDDGSIIIECVALGNRLTIGASGSELDPKGTLVGVPRFPLGPSRCWPPDQS